MPDNKPKITGVILAGGRASRMGDIDKGLVNLNGLPLIEHVINALKPQVTELLINANRYLARYEQYGYPVVPDQNDDYLGPLSGILASLQAVKTDYIFITPCDVPLLYPEIVKRMWDNLSNEPSQPCVAHDGQRIQPLFALLHKSLIDNLQQFLNHGERKAEIWITKLNPIIVDFSDQAECFININDPDDLSCIEIRLKQP